jgi:hypothetical protein
VNEVPPHPEPSNRVLSEKIDALHELVVEVDHAVRGNGKIGLVREMDSIKEWRTFVSKVFWMVAVPLVGTIVAGMIVTAVKVVNVVNRIEHVQQQDMQKP